MPRRAKVRLTLIAGGERRTFELSAVAPNELPEELNDTHITLELRTCLWCAARFVPASPSQVYCRDLCRVTSHRKGKKTTMTTNLRTALQEFPA